MKKSPDLYRLQTNRSAPRRLSPRAPAWDDVSAARKWLKNIEEPRALDVFCGAGGLSLGLENAGFNMVAGADSDAVALETYAHNTRALAFHGDLSDASEFIEGLRQRGIRKVELVAGGPPCTPFSRAGQSKIRDLVRKGTRDRLDPRVTLWQSLITVVAAFRPPMVLFENVPDFLRWSDGSALLELLDSLRGLGYQTDARLLEAFRHGVPQHRMRLFVVGVRRSLQMPNWPPPQKREATLADAIKDLPRVEAGTQRELRAYKGPQTSLQKYLRRGVPSTERRLVRDHNARAVRKDDAEAFKFLRQGQIYRDLPRRLQRYRVDIFDDKYKRLEWNAPSRTITAHIARDGYWYIHPTQTRTLSIREAARIQTFPDWFSFAGHPSVQFKQIGNAVPPRLAEALGIELRRVLGQHAVTRSNAHLLTRRRLLKWYKRERRDFPWRNVQDPWHLLLAEMSLRRTRAEQVAERFHELVAVAPTPHELLMNTSGFRRVMKHFGLKWRAQNVVDLARVLVENHAGKVPESEEALKKLPGVGDYVAAGVRCFGHGVPTVLVDTNTERIVSRLTGQEKLHAWQTRLELHRLAGPEGATEHFNYTLLDFGAKVCRAVDPKCSSCPLSDLCSTSGGSSK